jgi:hypothetical protein
MLRMVPPILSCWAADARLGRAINANRDDRSKPAPQRSSMRGMRLMMAGAAIRGSPLLNEAKAKYCQISLPTSPIGTQLREVSLFEFWPVALFSRCQ